QATVRICGASSVEHGSTAGDLIGRLKWLWLSVRKGGWDLHYCLDSNQLLRNRQYEEEQASKGQSEYSQKRAMVQ
ncbi:hypothetical protein, partial [Bradyrhizobium japonicum]